MVCTTITAIPRPIAASIFFDRARKVHMPKNMLRAILSIKTQYQTDIGTATMESVMQAEQLQADLKRQQMTNLVSTLFQGGTNADGTPMDSMVDSTVDTILDWVFGDDEDEYGGSNYIYAPEEYDENFVGPTVVTPV